MTDDLSGQPGDIFVLDSETILVEEYDAVLAHAYKLDNPDEPQPAYFLTFKGRINNKTEKKTVCVGMSPQDAMILVFDLLNGLEVWKESLK